MSKDADFGLAACLAIRSADTAISPLYPIRSKGARSRCRAVIGLGSVLSLTLCEDYSMATPTSPTPQYADLIERLRAPMKTCVYRGGCRDGSGYCFYHEPEGEAADALRDLQQRCEELKHQLSELEHQSLLLLKQKAAVLRECECREARIDKTQRDAPRAFVDTITLRALLAPPRSDAEQEKPA